MFLSLFNCYGDLGLKMYTHGNILVCIQAGLSAGRHRSVQIHRSHYNDSIPSGGLISFYQIESVLGPLIGMAL